ncbi:unnamed protein product [Caenorhabditis auriculariae]|uniref:Rad21/Rec8-like protein N-terminal domain-containing protein n=1 Tax=Caenorhabditis auriculariae TaxID=2777116 RepID=A0A8S1HM67_9PELO|nr:unnamed protein product [Caenorhabditis auriculariae]
MFYAQFVLAKKGPLAKIWLAAHWEKKLTKAQIFETDVPQAVEEMIKPKVKMALRTTGHLLLGVVRIYSKKARYLLADTNEAVLKIRLNFRHGFNLEIEPLLMEDYDVNQEMFEEMNVTIPEFLEAEAQIDYEANQCRLEDITLKDDYDMFGDCFRHQKLLLDDFGEESVYGSFESSSIPTPIERQPSSLIMDNGESSMQIRPDGDVVLQEFVSKVTGEHAGFAFEDAGFAPEDAHLFSMLADDVEMQREEIDNFGDSIRKPNSSVLQEKQKQDFNEGRSSFELQPLDLNRLGARAKGKRTTKKRKLVIDDATNIPSEQLKDDMQNFSDIIVPLSLAPPTKKLMNICHTGDVNYLMNTPGMDIGHHDLIKAYKECLVLRLHKPSNGHAPVDDPCEELCLSDEILPDGNYLEDTRMNDYADFEEEGFAAENQSVIEAVRDISDLSVPQNRSAIGFNSILHEEEKENDPLEPQATPSRGCLEAYGFGKKTVDECKWMKRTETILKKISTEIENSGKASFSNVVRSVGTRKSAAEHFYALLSLAKLQKIQVEQEEPFGDITILPGPKMIEFDQALDSVVVGPVPEGRHKFVFEASPPNSEKIPQEDLVGVSVLLLRCKYNEQEFLNLGWFVSNDYNDEELKANPPVKPIVGKLARTVQIDDLRVTSFSINWGGEQPVEYPPEEETVVDETDLMPLNDEGDDDEEDDETEDEKEEGEVDLNESIEKINDNVTNSLDEMEVDTNQGGEGMEVASEEVATDGKSAPMEISSAPLVDKTNGNNE